MIIIIIKKTKFKINKKKNKKLKLILYVNDKLSLKFETLTINMDSLEGCTSINAPLRRAGTMAPSPNNSGIGFLSS